MVDLAVSLTVIVLQRPVVGLIDSRPEALVTTSSSDHVWTRAVEGQELVFSVDL